MDSSGGIDKEGEDESGREGGRRRIRPSSDESDIASEKKRGLVRPGNGRGLTRSRKGLTRSRRHRKEEK